MSASENGSRVLVTGGAGFIGSHTVDALIERGNRVVVLDDFSTGRRENLARWAGDDRVEVIEADIADGLFAPLAETTRKRGPIDRIVHMAAQTSVVVSVERPLTDLRINYHGTMQVWEYARRTGAKKVAFASSAAVYGDVTTFPVTESAPLCPLSPYGIHKRGGELIASYHQEVHGVQATCLRFFNVYGPRQDPSSPYSGVISIFADRASDGRDLVIFGDGEQTRDFVYVADVASAVVTAVLTERGSGGVFNVGTGTEITVNELARHIVELSSPAKGKRSEIRHAEARAGEILRSVADVSRTRDALGFDPKTALSDGLRATLAD